jgi:hypothetical protein
MKCAEGYFLSLSDYKCYKSECPEGLLIVEFGETKVCRDPSKYYVNPDSDSPYEFGTIEYPFKEPVWVTREVFNLRSSVESTLTMYLYKQTTAKVHSVAAPLLFVNQADFRILPYPTESEEDELDLVLDENEKPLIHFSRDGHEVLFTSFYNPWKDSLTTYTMVARISAGDITASESQE